MLAPKQKSAIDEVRWFCIKHFKGLVQAIKLWITKHEEESDTEQITSKLTGMIVSEI